MRTIKKIIQCITSIMLSSLIIGFIGTIGFAEKTSSNKELTAAEIVSVPLKNRIVFTNGDPASPDGIKVRLVYIDDTETVEEIHETQNGYLAGNEELTITTRIDSVRYGILTTGLCFKNCEIVASYKYLSLPKWLGFLAVFIK